jgi:hypothetical protein
MKMFIWNNVLTDWTSGMIAVYAESLEQAIEIVKKEICYSEEELREEIINNPPTIFDSPGLAAINGGG